jgi:hypothetical protein
MERMHKLSARWLRKPYGGYHDTHVAICARMAGCAVIASDRLDLQRLDAKLRLIGV